MTNYMGALQGISSSVSNAVSTLFKSMAVSACCLSRSNAFVEAHDRWQSKRQQMPKLQFQSKPRMRIEYLRSTPFVPVAAPMMGDASRRSLNAESGQ
jgi:hypothetical protein